MQHAEALNSNIVHILARQGTIPLHVIESLPGELVIVSERPERRPELWTTYVHIVLIT
jgi:hypothetical protein